MFAATAAKRNLSPSTALHFKTFQQKRFAARCKLQMLTAHCAFHCNFTLEFVKAEVIVLYILLFPVYTHKHIHRIGAAFMNPHPYVTASAHQRFAFPRIPSLCKRQSPQKHTLPPFCSVPSAKRHCKRQERVCRIGAFKYIIKQCCAVVCYSIGHLPVA